MHKLRLWIIPVLVVALSGCGLNVVRPADTTPMPGEDRLPDGPGLFASSPDDSAREGYSILSGRCSDCATSQRAGGKAAPDSDTYRSFEAFRRMDPDSQEYREFDCYDITQPRSTFLSLADACHLMCKQRSRLC